ncbi:MAG: hypothetical protein ACE5MK_06255 [Acidobacteriota bacterium]
MKRRKWGIFTAVLLAGCAAFTAVGGKLTLSDQGFEVDLPQGWYRAVEAREALLLTRDGLPLQFIRIERVSVEEELSYSKRKFAPGMPPSDAAELEADNFRSNPAVFNFDLLENAPATVGDTRGFRLVYTWKTKHGLRLKRVHYGFLDGKLVYRLIYQAAAGYYFDRDAATFERELKELTSKVLFYAGHSLVYPTSGWRFVVTLFVNGTREVLWTSGVRSGMNKGKWWIDGDRMCVRNEKELAERCFEWRKNGDRIELWRANQKQGYIYILDKQGQSLERTTFVRRSEGSCLSVGLLHKSTGH